MIAVGAHVPGEDPVAEALSRDVDLVQIFLGPPQSWKKPPPRLDAGELQDSPVDIYVHAPYRLNLASPNNRIRIPSRKTLANIAEAAEQIGAAGLVVHGGHVTGGEPVEDGFPRWRKALESFETEVPILIENTASGDNAQARRIDDLARLWEVIGDLGPGFCLDTCHVWAGGEPLEGVVERVLEATGRIDLVHLNDSRDGFDSRRDRHANLGQGHIPGELLTEIVRQAGAPTIIETPGALPSTTPIWTGSGTGWPPLRPWPSCVRPNRVGSLAVSIHGRDLVPAFRLDPVHNRAVAGRVNQYPAHLVGRLALDPHLPADFPHQVVEVVRRGFTRAGGAEQGHHRQNRHHQGLEAPPPSRPDPADPPSHRTCGDTIFLGGRLPWAPARLQSAGPTCRLWWGWQAGGVFAALAAVSSPVRHVAPPRWSAARLPSAPIRPCVFISLLHIRRIID